MAVRNPLGGSGSALRATDAFAADQLSAYEYLAGAAANLAVASGELSDSLAAGAVIFAPPANPTGTDTFGAISFKWVTTNTGNVGILLKVVDSDDWLGVTTSISTPNIQIISMNAGTPTTVATTAPGAYTTNNYYRLQARIAGNVVCGEVVNMVNGSIHGRVDTVLAGGDVTKFGAGVSSKAYARLNSIANSSWKFDDLVLGKNLFVP